MIKHTTVKREVKRAVKAHKAMMKHFDSKVISKFESLERIYKADNAIACETLKAMEIEIREIREALETVSKGHDSWVERYAMDVNKDMFIVKNLDDIDFKAII